MEINSLLQMSIRRSYEASNIDMDGNFETGSTEHTKIAFNLPIAFSSEILTNSLDQVSYKSNMNTSKPSNTQRAGIFSIGSSRVTVTWACSCISQKVILLDQLHGSETIDHQGQMSDTAIQMTYNCVFCVPDLIRTGALPEMLEIPITVLEPTRSDDADPVVWELWRKNDRALKAIVGPSQWLQLT
jgi:hypothetical protein